MHASRCDGSWKGPHSISSRPRQIQSWEQITGNSNSNDIGWKEATGGGRTKVENRCEGIAINNIVKIIEASNLGVKKYEQRVEQAHGRTRNHQIRYHKHYCYFSPPGDGAGPLIIY